MAYREAPRVGPGVVACFYCGCIVQGGTCPSCMAEMQRSPGPVPITCRRCGGSLAKNSVGHGCTKCGGVFITGDDWDPIIETLRADGHVNHATIVPPPPGSAPQVDRMKNLSCACCGAQMERAPFGARSSINVDICPRHGIWLDSGELVGVLEFVRHLWKDNGGHILSAEQRRDAGLEREVLRIKIKEEARAETERRRLAQMGADTGGVGFDIDLGGGHSHSGGDGGSHH